MTTRFAAWSDPQAARPKPRKKRKAYLTNLARDLRNLAKGRT